MSLEENKAMIQRYLQVFTENKTDKLNEFVSNDYVYHGPGGYEVKGVENLKKYMTWLHNMAPNMNLTVNHIIAEGDKVATYFTGKGTDKRNKQLTVQGIIISHVVDGKVVEEWEIIDRFSMASQMAPGWAKAFLNMIEKQMEKDRP